MPREVRQALVILNHDNPRTDLPQLVADLLRQPKPKSSLMFGMPIRDAVRRERIRQAAERAAHRLHSDLVEYVATWNETRNTEAWEAAYPQLANRMFLAIAARVKNRDKNVDEIATLSPTAKARMMAGFLFGWAILQTEYQFWRCEHCHRYFASPYRHQRKYCSLRCKTAATAALSMKRKYDKARDTKLAAIGKALKQWSATRAKLAPQFRNNWKLWVATMHMKDKGVTVKFLTRAVHQGEIHEPTKREEKR